MFSKIHPASFLSMIALIAACDGSKAVDVPVDKTKTLAQLSTSELDSICGSLYDTAVDLKEEACLLLGVGLGTINGKLDKEKCESMVALCSQSPIKPKESFKCPLREDAEAVKSCQGTVQEVEDCINEEMQDVQDAAARASCTMQDPKSLKKGVYAACVALKKKCAGLRDL